MPAKSRAQQEAMAIAEHAPGTLDRKNRGLLKMSHTQLHDFAATPRKGLPARVGASRAPRLRMTETAPAAAPAMRVLPMAPEADGMAPSISRHFGTP